MTYELQEDDSCSTPGFATCSFPSPEVSVSGTPALSYRPSTDLPASTTAPVGRRYYWRVRACDGSGRCGAWSAVRYLDLGRVPGDVNGDGWSDVLVGAPYNDATGATAGRAYVFLGGAAPDATVDLTLSGAAAGDLFGFSVAEAGDVNADGFAEFVVAAPDLDAGGANSGRAYVFFGAAAPDATADWILTGAAATRLGTSVDGAGDVNGDGFADLVVGAEGTGLGRVDVFLGAAAPDPAPDATAYGRWDGNIECPEGSGSYEDYWLTIGNAGLGRLMRRLRRGLGGRRDGSAPCDEGAVR